MRIRIAIGLQVVNMPEGPGLHVPHAALLVDTELLDQPGVLSAILLCQDWRERSTVEQVFVREAGWSRGRAAQSVDELLQYGILISEEDAEQRTGAAAYETWKDRDWGDAFAFQWHIDHLPCLDYFKDGPAEDVRGMKGFLAKDPVPNNYKEVPSARVVPLLRDVRIEHGPIWELLTQADDVSFPDRPLTFQELSWMTLLAFGQTGTHKTHYGELLAKTSPSGGARHPTEAYLLVFDADEVEPGAYHYSVKSHALELLQAGDLSPIVDAHMLRKPGLALFKRRLVYVTSSRCERTMWRYRQSFSYRSVNHDLGHVMETTRLLALALRRNHFRGFAPKESVLEPLLRLDGVEESIMTYSIIG